jgi:transcriptional regulator with XRE-family HTH domain
VSRRTAALPQRRRIVPAIGQVWREQVFRLKIAAGIGKVVVVIVQRQSAFIKHETLEQLAERLNIGQNALSRMEKGAISPKTARLRDFAAILQCSPADLFRETETEPDVGELTAILAELISPLPPHARQAIVRIVKESAALADSGKTRP